MSRTYDTVLVIGAGEKLSSIVDWEDRNTCVLFGDGAGAAIFTKIGPHAHGLAHRRDGGPTDKNPICSSCPAAAAAARRPPASVNSRLHYLRMEGKETFKCAVAGDAKPPPRKAMRRCEIDITKIKCVIPHQANRRIIDVVG